MIRLAVVGDIGAGKSHIAKLFGYPVFSADDEVSKLYKKNRKCYLKLKKVIPNYVKSFPVKKKKLSEAIMDNHNNLKKIIKIVHPEIKLLLNAFIKKNKNKKFIVLDIPLLMENKINKKNDVLILVDEKKKEINKRLIKRYKDNLKILKKLKKFQVPVELKRKKADFVIKNNFKNNNAKKNVKNVLGNLLNA